MVFDTNACTTPESLQVFASHASYINTNRSTRECMDQPPTVWITWPKFARRLDPYYNVRSGSIFCNSARDATIQAKAILHIAL